MNIGENMRRYRRSGGKRLTGIEFGFTIFQMFAIMFLLGIIVQYFNARTTFKDVAEFVPVTITYDSVESYVVKDSDGDRETKYRCEYSYVVDGKRYQKEVTKSTSVSVGDQAKRYYNPENPSQIAGYRNAEEMLADLSNVRVLFVCFQCIAIIFLFILIRKKLKRRKEKNDYDERLRRNVERNMEVYKNIDITVNRTNVAEILDPLREKAYIAQKRFETYEKWENFVIVGNPFIAIFYIVLRLIAQIFIKNAKEKMLETKAAFSKEYKRLIAEPVLEHIFDDYTYRPSQGFSANQLTSFKLCRDSMLYVTTEDLIEGTYKGVHYCQSDIKREKRSNESNEFAYAGRISVYDFNKPLEGEILIANKGNSNLVSFGMVQVSMESVEFNNAFQVYASDSHIAYYVLTPQFMEYMLRLNVHGEFSMRICHNHVYVLRNHIDGIFEPNLKSPIDVDYEIGKSYVELKEILDFVEVLNLDRITLSNNNLDESSWEETIEKNNSLEECDLICNINEECVYSENLHFEDSIEDVMSSTDGIGKNGYNSATSGLKLRL